VTTIDRGEREGERQTGTDKGKYTNRQRSEREIDIHRGGEREKETNLDIIKTFSVRTCQRF